VRNDPDRKDGQDQIAAKAAAANISICEGVALSGPVRDRPSAIRRDCRIVQIIGDGQVEKKFFFLATSRRPRRGQLYHMNNTAPANIAYRSSLSVF
jgi:hypothetical protein